MSEAPSFETLSPAGLPVGKMEDNTPVNVDAILQAILGRGGERFGMVAAVLRGEGIGGTDGAVPGQKSMFGFVRPGCYNSERYERRC
jgi:hypothetical protein